MRQSTGIQPEGWDGLGLGLGFCFFKVGVGGCTHLQQDHMNVSTISLSGEPESHCQCLK